MLKDILGIVAFVGAMLNVLGLVCLVQLWKEGKSHRILSALILAAGTLFSVVGIGGAYLENNNQKHLVLADAKEVFGDGVELVKTKSPFSNINVESDGVRYRTYKENGKIFYEEISIIVDEKEYGDRVIRKSE